MTTEAPSAAPSLSAERLASLSDTMFGVAMTLVATTLLPAVQAHKPLVDLWRDIGGEVSSVALSFAISARYWVLQQQRLAMSGSVDLRGAALHLVFLFLIVLVPISTSLPGLAGPQAARGSVVVYGAHLSLIALVNLALWLDLHRRAAVAMQAFASAVSLAMFLLALGVGVVQPALALYLWVAVLAAPLLTRVLARGLG